MTICTLLPPTTERVLVQTAGRTAVFHWHCSFVRQAQIRSPRSRDRGRRLSVASKSERHDRVCLGTLWGCAVDLEGSPKKALESLELESHMAVK